MTSLFFEVEEKSNRTAEATQQTGASYSVKRPASPRSPYAGDHGGHKGIHSACIIRTFQSCGYACFWGLFGRLVAVWRVFEVALRLQNFSSSNGVVACVQSIRDNMQVMRLYVVVMALIRNTSMLELAL